MARTRAQLWATGFGLAAIAAALPGLRFRGEPKILLSVAGVSVERVDGALVPRGARLGARGGDLLLSNGVLEIVVGASSQGDRRQDFGAILDVTGPGLSDDALTDLRRALLVDGQRVALVTERAEAVLAQAAPILRITERDSAGTVLLVTDVTTKPRGEIIEMVTTLTYRGPNPVAVRLGDAVDWSGVLTFAPGHGEVEDPGSRSLRWFGRRGALTYGMVFPAGPADVEFRVFLSETDQTAWMPAVQVSADGTVRFRRALVTTRQGLSDVARQAAGITRTSVGSVRGALEPVPAWALLTAIASDGTIALTEEGGADGTFELHLPPGRYTLVLQTPGGWDETTVEVDAGLRPVTARLLVPQSERLDFRITDTSGRPVPARLVVTGIDGTPDPRFTSVAKVSAAGNEVHSVTGEGRVDVPAGRYRVVVSRGLEWSVAERVVEVKHEQGVALRVVLGHTMPTPGWVSADLHLHAHPSADSELPLDDRVASLLSAGVEFAVATDHNHVTDYSGAVEAAGARALLKTVPGVEITTRTWGHFNAYPLAPGSEPPPFAGVNPAEIFAATRKAHPGAVIQVNHPWSAGYGYFHRAALNERTGAVWRKEFSFDFDLIEVLNGYELGTADVVTKNLRRYFDLIELGHRYAAVGSSDSHKLTNEWAGYPRTYVRVADDRPDRIVPSEVVASLRKGHAIVSLGPFVDARVGDAGPGDTVATLPGTVPLDVTIRASPWVSVSRVEIVLNGKPFAVFDVTTGTTYGSMRWAEVVDIPAEQDSWVAVVVHGERPLDPVLPGKGVLPTAFTNPIWIDVEAPPDTPPPVRRGPSSGAATRAAESPAGDLDAAPLPPRAGDAEAGPPTPLDAMAD